MIALYSANKQRKFRFLQGYPYWRHDTPWFLGLPEGMWPDIFSPWGMP